MSQQPFATKEVEPGIWQISDVLGDRAYLVMGDRAAALVDTCAGYGDISTVVSELTDLPVTVLLTHSHYDHIAGSYFFHEAYIAPEDDGQWEYEKGLAQKAYKELTSQGDYVPDMPFAPRDGKMPRVLHVHGGDVFELGNVSVEAVALPGHTQGSMGYLVRERRVLLSGDAVTPVMCLFFEQSMGIPVYRHTLAKMGELPFDRFYTGHHDVGFLREDLSSFDACAAFAETDRGISWQHSVLPEFMGTIHLAPCDTTDVDSPEFRALIGPYVPRPKRKGRRRRSRKD